MLLQQQEDSKTWLPLGFWSRTLSSAEKNYDTTNKECLAVVWAVLSLRPYLEGTRFLIRTDHDALKWLLNLTTPSGRLLRWKLRIQEYDYDITHRPGAQHKAADALSRIRTDGTDQRPLDDGIPTINVADWIESHEDTAQLMVTRVCVQDEGPVCLGQRQDWWLDELVFQSLEGGRLLVC